MFKVSTWLIYRTRPTHLVGFKDAELTHTELTYPLSDLNSSECSPSAKETDSQRTDILLTFHSAVSFIHNATSIIVNKN